MQPERRNREEGNRFNFTHTKTFALPNAHLFPRNTDKITDFTCVKCGQPLLEYDEETKAVVFCKGPVMCKDNYNFKMDKDGNVQVKKWSEKAAQADYEKSVIAQQPTEENKEE